MGFLSTIGIGLLVMAGLVVIGATWAWLMNHEETWSDVMAWGSLFLAIAWIIGGVVTSPVR